MSKRISKLQNTDRFNGTDILANAIIEGMQEKKASDIVSLDLRNVENSIADIFIICHAESGVHVEAIARSVEEMVFKNLDQEPEHKEGRENAEWILLDYFDVVVHVFIKEKRDYYNLESLWGDGELQQIAQS